MALPLSSQWRMWSRWAAAGEAWRWLFCVRHSLPAESESPESRQGPESASGFFPLVVEVIGELRHLLGSDS